MFIGPLRWRKVPGFNAYEISERGDIFSSNTGYLTKGSRNSLGYFQFRFAGSIHAVNVHRVLLLAFVGDPPKGKPWACHRDDDTTNNTLGNLYWGSAKENHVDAVRNGTKTHLGRRKVSSEQIQIMKERREQGHLVQDIARDLGVHSVTVQNRTGPLPAKRKTCEFCQNTFETARANQKCCSKLCQRRKNKAAFVARHGSNVRKKDDVHSHAWQSSLIDD